VSTRRQDSVFAQLGFQPDEALNLRLRSEMMNALLAEIETKGLTQAQAAAQLARPGPAQIAGYNVSVERTAKVYTSFKAADEAGARDDAAMSPAERLNILIELRDRRHPDAAEQRLARVYRIVELARS
jgi:predicted XRE-type DNA-binding protein